MIEQRGLSINCKVLNISLGGMLSEFEMDAHFNCIDPVMITLSLGSDEIKLESIYCILSNIKVIKRNSDHTPSLVRMGFKFLQVPDKAFESLEVVLDQAEAEVEDTA